MVKFILIKSPDEWATPKQACRDELVVYLFFPPQYILRFTPICIERCFTAIKFYTLTILSLRTRGTTERYQKRKVLTLISIPPPLE